MMPFKLSARLSAAVAIGLLVAACAHSPAPLTLSDTVQATATVQAVDAASRTVRLVGADGRPMLVRAGPSVRNFEQLKAGDRVTVRYTEAIAAEVVKPGTGVTSSAPAVTADRSPSGERPRASAEVSVKGVVRVVSVDAVNNTVEVVTQDGLVRRVRVVDSKAREFARGLKPGDEVQLTFTEALAVAVEPVNPAR
jgi:hypothetical protein